MHTKVGRAVQSDSLSPKGAGHNGLREERWEEGAMYIPMLLHSLLGSALPAYCIFSNFFLSTKL